jgi:hypothetical protein
MGSADYTGVQSIAVSGCVSDRFLRRSDRLSGGSGETALNVTPKLVDLARP